MNSKLDRHYKFNRKRSSNRHQIRSKPQSCFKRIINCSLFLLCLVLPCIFILYNATYVKELHMSDFVSSWMPNFSLSLSSIMLYLKKLGSVAPIINAKFMVSDWIVRANSAISTTKNVITTEILSLSSKESENHHHDIPVIGQLYTSSAPMQNTQKFPKIFCSNLVLGMAQDMDPKNFAVFSGSIRKVNQIAAVHIFMNLPIDNRLKLIAKSHQITIEPYDLKKEKYPDYHPSTLRWILFQKFLNSHYKFTTILNRILFIDARDSYFQIDPFADLPPYISNFFYVFTGVESIILGKCSWNSGWVKDCFGPDILHQIYQRMILCSGVSMADGEWGKLYVDAMADIMGGEKSTELQRLAKFPTCERNGVDQGVHNVLVHLKAINKVNFTIFDQTKGLVANMQAKQYRMTPDYRILNGAMRLVAVVHQYDRNPKLQMKYFKQFVSWMDPSDLEAEWKANKACKTYSYQRNVDQYKGVCDMKGRGGVTSPASCCAICDTTTGCQSFVYLSGMCFLKNCGVSGRAARATPVSDAWSATKEMRS